MDSLRSRKLCTLTGMRDLMLLRIVRLSLKKWRNLSSKSIWYSFNLMSDIQNLQFMAGIWWPDTGAYWTKIRPWWKVACSCSAWWGNFLTKWIEVVSVDKERSNVSLKEWPWVDNAWFKVHCRANRMSGYFTWTDCWAGEITWKQVTLMLWLLSDNLSRKKWGQVVEL